MLNELTSTILNDRNQINDSALKQLSIYLISFLVNPTNSNFQENLQRLIAENNHRLNLSTYKTISQSLLLLFQEALVGHYSKSRIEERCAELGLSDNSKSLISNVWQDRLVEITTSLLSRSITNNKLTDMDWSFGITSSSDDCNNVGKTFLQLKLTFENQRGNQNTVFMELSLEQFYQFLASMEKCKSYLDYISLNDA